MWKRPAVMAGKFYPREKRELLRTIQEFLSASPSAHKEVVGILAPHAGYVYSGKVAASVFGAVKIPETVIILCPNHTGRGPKLSIWSEGYWETPLGKVPVAEGISSEILKALHLKDGDMLAHINEHAIEVELPFLQYFQPNLKIVPIVVGRLTYQECVRVAVALKEVIETKPNGSVLLVASSDMSHYIPAEEALIKDEIAIGQIERLNPKGLYDVVLREEISMCGFIPTTIVLEACQELGAKTAQRVSYSTSGDTTEDYSSVVSYASALFMV